MTNQPTKSKRKAASIALFKAVRSSDVKGVRAAIADKPDLSAVSRGRTAFQRAMRDFPRSWNTSVVACLMDAGAAIPKMNEWHRRAFAWGLAEGGENKALQSVLDSSKGPEELLHVREQMANVWGALQDKMHAVAPVVFSSKSCAEERIDNGMTWLHVAVCGSTHFSMVSWQDRWPFWQSNLPLLKYLLALQPRVDIRWSGSTPLQFAAYHGHDAAFDMLIDAGADVDLPDGNEEVLHSKYHGITPHQWARVRRERLKKALTTVTAGPVRAPPRGGRL